MTQLGRAGDQPPSGHPWDRFEASRPSPTRHGSTAWAIGIALSLWLLLLTGFGFVAVVSFVLLEGGAEAAVADALDDPGWVVLTWVAILGSLAPSVGLGVRAERLDGSRSVALVTLGTVLGYATVTLTGVWIAALPLAIGVLAGWFVSRRRRSPNRTTG